MIRRYVEAAAKLYTNRKCDNPFKPEKEDLRENFPELIITALEKYEKVKNRKEPVTDSMFQYIIDLAKKEPPDSLICALRDWFIWSRYGGPRQSEWCQTTKANYQKVTEGGESDEAQAFILNDITASDLEGRVLDLRRVPLNRVDSINVCWRFQKNQQN